MPKKGFKNKWGWGHAEISGFRYAVPYVKALEFPQQLTSILYEFTEQFPQDLFTLESLYLALYAWYDTVTSTSYNTEKALPEGSHATSAYTVPESSLAECLVYYTHWLRWTKKWDLLNIPIYFDLFDKLLIPTDVICLSLLIVVWMKPTSEPQC